MKTFRITLITCFILCLSAAGYSIFQHGFLQNGKSYSEISADRAIVTFGRGTTKAELEATKTALKEIANIDFSYEILAGSDDFVTGLSISTKCPEDFEGTASYNNLCFGTKVGFAWQPKKQIPFSTSAGFINERKDFR